eukprot:1325876-Pyramimonas_sp.AAC.1
MTTSNCPAYKTRTANRKPQSKTAQLALASGWHQQRRWALRRKQGVTNVSPLRCSEGAGCDECVTSAVL